MVIAATVQVKRRWGSGGGECIHRGCKGSWPAVYYARQVAIAEMYFICYDHEFCSLKYLIFVEMSIL